MPFMERLQSALILKTSLYHPLEAAILDKDYFYFYDAIKRNDSDKIIGMIYDGFDVDHSDFGHTPPLIYALEHEAHQIAQVLLVHGANVNILHKDSCSALHYAIKLQNYEMALLLVRYGADQKLETADNETALSIAQNLNDTTMIEILNDTSTMLDQNMNIFHAVIEGNLAQVSESVQSPQDLLIKTLEKQTLLHLSVKSGNIKLINYLLNKNVDVECKDQFGNTAFTLSCITHDRIDILELLNERHHLLDHKNAKGSAPLMLCLQFGHVKSAKFLIENGANIHIYDAIQTPLTLVHNAIDTYPNLRKEYQELESLLLIKGANVDMSTNKLKWTPLIQCVTRAQNTFVKNHINLLVNLGAHINYQDTNGRSALMLAGSMGKYAPVQQLMENYANVNLKDNFGWSALMLAVYYNHENIVLLLLEYGCDISIESEHGLDAYKIAKEHKRESIVTLLEEFGAKE